MDQQTNRIECHKCGYEIDVNDILYRQVDQELKKKYLDELAEEKKKYDDKSNSLKLERDKLEQKKKQQNEMVANGVKAGLDEEKKKLQVQLKKRLEEEQSEQFKALQQELNQKSNQLKAFNKAKSEIERLKREKSELKDSLEAASEKKINEILSKERNKIRKIEEEKSQLKISEKEKVILQLSEQLKEAQRKAEQGSMQLQGEVQELAIEKWLAENFLLDTIQEIKKGVRGADCLQIVNTRIKSNCGTIYYESKRTKEFKIEWIEKFKHDIQEKSADIGVLVNESMPNDMERLGLKDGVWVCTFEEFKGLCTVLRDSIIRLSNAVIIQENKGDKMVMLYDYLTGNEFRMQVEAIVEGFSQMKTDLDSEKRAMSSIWKKREKQIQKVLLNTNFMHSSIKGIAGNAIQTVSLLELPLEAVD